MQNKVRDSPWREDLGVLSEDVPVAGMSDSHTPRVHVPPPAAKLEGPCGRGKHSSDVADGHPEEPLPAPAQRKVLELAELSPGVTKVTFPTSSVRRRLKHRILG